VRRQLQDARVGLDAAEAQDMAEPDVLTSQVRSVWEKACAGVSRETVSFSLPV
jgi:hypothetical protein